jgi:hypothetical protein
MARMLLRRCQKNLPCFGGFASTLEVTGFGKDPSVFELQDRSCYENDITAMPTGQISGRVIAPDGPPLRSTSVELYRADQYGEEQAGAAAARRAFTWKMGSRS